MEFTVQMKVEADTEAMAYHKATQMLMLARNGADMMLGQFMAKYRNMSRETAEDMFWPGTGLDANDLRDTLDKLYDQTQELFERMN